MDKTRTLTVAKEQYCLEQSVMRYELREHRERLVIPHISLPKLFTASIMKIFYSSEGKLAAIILNYFTKKTEK